MTVAMQSLSEHDQGRFETFLKNGQFVTKLGPLVQDAIRSDGSSQLQQKIAIETLALMDEFSGARIENIVDQSFNRQISETVDKAITRALEGRSGELQSAIEQIVTKAVDAKLNELKNKAPVRTQKRRGK